MQDSSWLWQGDTPPLNSFSCVCVWLCVRTCLPECAINSIWRDTQKRHKCREQDTENDVVVCFSSISIMPVCQCLTSVTVCASLWSMCICVHTCWNMTSTVSVGKIVALVYFYLRERERLSGRDVPCDSLCVQQREQPSVPGCALEIPLGIGVSDLLLHSAMLYIGWLIMVLFIP